MDGAFDDASRFVEFEAENGQLLAEADQHRRRAEDRHDIGRAVLLLDADHGLDLDRWRVLGVDAIGVHVDGVLARYPSYVRKLVTELSGGVFGYLDSVLERHSFDEFGELI